MILASISDRWRTTTRVALTTGCLVALSLLAYDWLISGTPWPAAKSLLQAGSDCRILGRPMTNEESEAEPIEVAAGQSISITGEIESWDYPFSRSFRTQDGKRAVSRSADEPQIDERSPLVFVTFRQQGWIRNLLAGSYRYEGKGGFEVEPDGSSIRLLHRIPAPQEPGLYRVQLHYVETSPSLRARMLPEEANKPVGILAEAILRVTESADSTVASID